MGSNGTFYEGKRISRALVKNGMVIRLARSGPQLQISLDVLRSEKTSQIPVSKEDLETAQGSFSGTRESSQFSEDEFEQAKVTDTDD